MLGMHFTDPKDSDPIQDVDRIRLWDCGVTWKDIGDQGADIKI